MILRVNHKDNNYINSKLLVQKRGLESLLFCASNF